MQLRFEYTPRDFLSFGLGYRYIERDSNRVIRIYDNSIYTASFKITL